MPASNLWLPRITASNALAHRRVGAEATQDAMVHADGRVVLRSRIYMETSCGMNTNYFPFDTHDCPIVFSSSLPTSYMDIHPEIRLHSTDEMFGDFSITEVNLEQNVIERGRDEYKEIRFVARLVRHSSSLVFSVILPSSFLVAALLAVHHSRALQGEDCTEKSSLILSTFLVFLLHSGLLAFLTPRGATLSMLGWLLLGQTTLSLFSLIISLVSVNKLSNRKHPSASPSLLYRLSCLQQPRPRPEEREKFIEYLHRVSSPSEASNGTGHIRQCSERRRDRLREEQWAKIHARSSLIILLLLEVFNLIMLCLFFYTTTRPTPARINYN
ncbi:hypothetical protein PFISCL1PPCAC_7218 [Pristionchus fissidentatus]|uniref:Neurotransmitter-gated ion-channel ligand-binding domain-containing protein n=1 Tax=Pristionchus fissidentatus TaxID=1538716 RepID=A0AAV5VB26_9BILA|nr:hypothetical protein PFISCL1PPCAC_7218 [Pristionchus fissidentatus]